MASINTDEWQAELDRLMANVGPKVIPKEGFTLNDVMNRYDKKASSALRFIKALIASGQVVEIGVRPGVGGAKVYNLVKSLQDAPGGAIPSGAVPKGGVV